MTQIILLDPQLARVVFWIAVACCAVAQVAIVRSAMRPPSGADAGTAGGSVPQPGGASELAWTLIPAVVLAAVLAATWQVLPR